ncbi:hypothetical protein V6N13_025810 [Hibiscus sabdariffa]
MRVGSNGYPDCPYYPLLRVVRPLVITHYRLISTKFNTGGPTSCAHEGNDPSHEDNRMLAPEHGDRSMKRAWTLRSSAWQALLVTAGDSWSAWEAKGWRVTTIRPRVYPCYNLDRWITMRSNGRDAAAAKNKELN